MNPRRCPTRLAVLFSMSAAHWLSGGVAADQIHVYAGESIQAAIEIASDGDEIIVHPGTYYEAIDFLGKAIWLHSSDGADVTTIDAAGLDLSVVKCVSGEGPDTVLSGFTITNGKAVEGGGMHNSSSSPTVMNCTFVGNVAAGADHVFGGGMYNFSSSPTLMNCTFADNSAVGQWDGYGGGLLNENSSTTVMNCTFSGNMAGGSSKGDGGGILDVFSSGSTVMNCTFTGNTVDGYPAWGGGILATENSLIANCIFMGNSAGEAGYGGGLLVLQNNDVTNCTFSENTAFEGGGLYIPAGSSTITNCIVWGNDGGEIHVDGGSPVVTYSDVKGGWPGEGNINIDPKLHWDGHLKAGSPCIDAGNNWGLPADEHDIDADGKTCESIPVDLDGNPRFANDPATTDTGCGLPVIVDMGAYEYPGEPAEIVFADVNDDSVVDVLDLLAVLTDWGPHDGCSLSNFDISGTIDVLDLLEVLSAWGPCL